MTLAQLRYLIAIVDANLNISLAASRMNATQPGISKQLKLLETELGFPIFTRRGRNLERLTPSGADLIRRARTILDEVHNIHTLAANHRHDMRGVLRVATAQTLGRFVLPPALGSLRSRFPDVVVRLHPAGEDEALEMLERDEIDLALVSTEGQRPPGELALPLFRWRRMLVVTRDHPLASRREPLTLAELAAMPLVASESSTRVDYKIGRLFHEQGLEPNIVCTARDADTIKTFVRLDLGVGLIAEMALTAADADLVDLNAGGLFPECTTWAIMRRRRLQRDYVLELLSAITPSLDRNDISVALGTSEDIDLTGRVPAWSAKPPRRPNFLAVVAS